MFDAFASSSLPQFAALRDPRQAAMMFHSLPEVLLLLCSTVPGVDGSGESALGSWCYGMAST